MNTETFEQPALVRSLLEHVIPYLKENTVLEIESYNGEALDIALPMTVELLVVEAPPWLCGRHGHRRQQRSDARDRAQAERAAIYQRGRRLAHRHAHGRVPDPRLASRVRNSTFRPMHCMGLLLFRGRVEMRGGQYLQRERNRLAQVVRQRALQGAGLGRINRG